MYAIVEINGQAVQVVQDLFAELAGAFGVFHVVQPALQGGLQFVFGRSDVTTPVALLHDMVFVSIR